MAVDIFLVIPTTSTNPPVAADPVSDQYFRATFTKASVVPILQFSLDVENTTTAGSASTGAGSGKAKLNPFSIEKPVDTLSRSLYSLSATGGHLSTAQVYLRKSGAAGGKPYLAYEFAMVFVTKMEWSAGSGDDAVTERVTFAYGAMTLAYLASKPDGSFGTAVRQGWNQVTNTAAGPDAIIGF